VDMVTPSPAAAGYLAAQRALNGRSHSDGYPRPSTQLRRKYIGASWRPFCNGWARACREFRDRQLEWA
jgi:hypothetical protein